MREASRLSAPLFVITGYFGLLAGLVWALQTWLPSVTRHLPFGGIGQLEDEPTSHMEIVESFSQPIFTGDLEALTLALATIGALLLMVPVSWVYFLTTTDKRIDRSFIQTMMVLPVIVAGIASIVQHSLPLAFSLAGIVAAVRFRFTLTEPAHTLYIFVAIVIGLAAGVSAMGIAYVISVGFVYTSLVLWRSNYGANLNRPFYSFLTGRGHDDNDL